MQAKFYVARKTKFSWGIYWFQKYFLKFDEETSKNTHVEAFFEDGWMYGSSEVDGGVRKKHMAKFKTHWETVDIHLTKQEENHCRKFLEVRLGEKYDRAGILFSQLLRTNWFLRKNKYFCSEIVVEMIQDLLQSEVITFETFKRYSKFVGVSSHMVSPAQLRILLK